MESNRITIKNLLEAGIHFGHKSKRWNPKMQPFIFGELEILLLCLADSLMRLTSGMTVFSCLPQLLVNGKYEKIAQKVISNQKHKTF